MKSIVLRSAALMVALFPVTYLAHAQNPACESVQFSAQVLDRFPGARTSCLDVIEHKGQQYAVFKAQLLEVRGNSLRLRVKGPDGKYGPTTTMTARADRQVLIDGKPYPVRDLAPNQELTAYVRVDSPQIALAPVNESEPLESFPLAEPDEASGPVKLASAEEPTMPDTAGWSAYLVILATFLLTTAVILTVMRLHHRRSS
jgi:hypothetical protein